MAERTCTIEGCERGGKIQQGWCSMHYQRWKRNGDPARTVRDMSPKGPGNACAKCGADEWQPVRNSWQCRPCKLAGKAAFRAANKEALRASRARYYAENADKAREDARRYYAENPEERRQYSAQWRTEHPDRVRAAAARWRTENADRLREYRSSTADARAADSAKRRAARKRVPIGAVNPTWRAVAARDGMECALCSVVCDPSDGVMIVLKSGARRRQPGRAYPTLDHIHPLVYGGHHAMHNAQLLCFSCNAIKNTSAGWCGRDCPECNAEASCDCAAPI